MTNVETAIPPLKTPRKPRPSEIAAKAEKAKTIYSLSVRKTAKVAKAKKGRLVSAPKKAIGRPFMYPDMTLVRMPKGTLKRVHSALKTDEGQADFMRTSIMTELKRRRK